MLGHTQILAYGALFAMMANAPAVLAGELVTPRWVNELGGELGGIVGPWIAEEVIGGVRWMTLVASAGILVGVVILHALLHWVVRRKIRKDGGQSAAAPPRERESHHWWNRSLHAAVPPLAVLLWIYGLYAAVSLILLDFQSREAAEGALGALRVVKALAALAAGFWLLYRVGAVLESRLNTLSSGGGATWDSILFPLAGKAVRLTLPLLVLIFGVPMLPVSADIRLLFQNGISLLLIAAVAFILFQIVQATEQFLLSRYPSEGGDPLQARKVHTQVTVLKKIAVVVIGVFTLASMLMVFESVRRFGTSILASAGIAGVIIGVAAQRSLATLLAGFQIAITQPIRIGDAVIVENEWGTIEDITLTYVVVRVWDLRRVIVPITYFIEKPFQNWTLSSSEILGPVYLYVDYAMPIQPLREELDRILERSPYWNRKVKVLQVTDVKERTLELRVLASGPDAPRTWDLRCEVREKLIDFIQKNYPQCLPRLRADVAPAQAMKLERREDARRSAAGR